MDAVLLTVCFHPVISDLCNGFFRIQFVSSIAFYTKKIFFLGYR